MTLAETKTSVDLSLPAAKPSAERPKLIVQHWRTVLLAVAVVALFAASVLLGSYTVTIPDFFRILGAHLTGGEKIPGASFIVMEHKLPRAVVGALIGAGDLLPAGEVCAQDPEEVGDGDGVAAQEHAGGEERHDGKGQRARPPALHYQFWSLSRGFGDGK